MIRKLLGLLFFLALLAGVALYWAVATPYAAYDGETFVDIPSGTGVVAMGRMLADAGVLRGDWQFLAVRAIRPTATLQAGEYRFNRPMTALEVFNKIARGDIHHYTLIVPEGSNMFDIAEAVGKLGTMKAADFLQVARDAAMIRDLSPDAPSLEGYLFPSTYRLTRRTTPQQLAREMTGQFRRVWKQLDAQGADVNRMVTLASLVEKETGVPAERRTVASVYKNRLDIGMKLDADPTTIYASLLEGRFTGSIRRSDLDSTHPYNTYRNRGLPPGPIANPGAESLKAALNPAETPYLFFVARGDGSGAHVFTENLSQHNAAVRDYRNAISR